MPRYRFRWEALTPSLLRRLRADLDLDHGNPAQRLRDTYGARPDGDFVKLAWPALLDGWLARDRAARRSVVAALRGRRLGAHQVAPANAAAELDYLRSCRNSAALRDVVLEHLLAAGERSAAPKPEAPATFPSAPSNTGHSAAWPTFATALASCLAAMEEDQFLIVSLKRHPGYFVQFAVQGPSGLRAETVSNNDLEDWERLDPHTERRLAGLGWLPPAGVDGSPNHFRDWAQPVPFDEVTALAVRTLTQVFEVPHPGYLAYKAFARNGAAVLLPNLGVSRQRNGEMAQPVAAPAEAEGMTRERLTALVDGALRQMRDGDAVTHDDDGDVPIRFGSTIAYVRVAEDAPIVRVLAPVIWDVPCSPGLLEAINDLNGSIRFARARFDGKGVTLAAEVPGQPFSVEHIVNAVKAVGTLADENTEVFQERFGGRVYFGESLPAKQDPPTGGYL